MFLYFLPRQPASFVSFLVCCFDTVAVCQMIFITDTICEHIFIADACCPFCSALVSHHTFNGPLSGITRVSQYQKGKTNLDFNGARDSEWQWHQLGRMQVCTSLQTDNHTSTPPLSFLQAGCPSCRPTNSVNARRHRAYQWIKIIFVTQNPEKISHR